MKNLKTVIAALGVFAMTIGSGFAMDNNPPTEPVKVVAEAEGISYAPMQVAYSGRVAYKDSSENCIEITPTPNTSHCTTSITGDLCLMLVSGVLETVYAYERNPVTEVWECTFPLYKIPDPF